MHKTKETEPTPGRLLKKSEATPENGSVRKTEAKKRLKEEENRRLEEKTALAMERSEAYTGKRALRWVMLLLAVAACIVIGVKLLAERRYNLISAIIMFLACLPFYFAYEKREGSIRRMVMIAVMTAIAVVGRLIFGAVPAVKPLTATVIMTGMYMGPESGFLVGSLSAVVSNIFFGQGPWTPFQMFTLGLQGLIAGLPFMRRLLRKRVPLILYGLFAGALYSWIMDIWTVISLIGKWSFKRYLIALGTAIPYTVTYMISNVIFLLLMRKPIGEKLERIQIKHGIF